LWQGDKKGCWFFVVVCVVLAVLIKTLSHLYVTYSDIACGGKKQSKGDLFLSTMIFQKLP
jgi:hypothetical protein